MKTPERTASSYSFDEELQTYLEGAGLNTSNSPLDFWKQNYKVYPTLAKLAQKYLSVIPASSVSERVFSIAGNLVTKKKVKAQSKQSKYVGVLTCSFE